MKDRKNQLLESFFKNKKTKITDVQKKEITELVNKEIKHIFNKIKISFDSKIKSVVPIWTTKGWIRTLDYDKSMAKYGESRGDNYLVLFEYSPKKVYEYYEKINIDARKDLNKIKDLLEQIVDEFNDRDFYIESYVEGDSSSSLDWFEIHFEPSNEYMDKIRQKVLS